MAELEFEKRLREFVPRDDFERAACKAAQRVRAVVANMGERLGPRVVSVPIHEAIAIINSEAARILDELAAQPQRTAVKASPPSTGDAIDSLE